MSDVLTKLKVLQNQGKISSQKTSKYIDEFAKLVAKENLSFIRKTGVSTACIDLEKRIVYIPFLVDINSDISELFYIHEISHALWTPKDGWHKEVSDKRGHPIRKDIFNILEDIRIEKLAKRKLPGLSNIFKEAYRSLWLAGFFGSYPKGNIETNLLDTLNLFYKVGPQEISFVSNPHHELFIQKASFLETWQDVVDLEKEIFQFLKEKSVTMSSVTMSIESNFNSDQKSESASDQKSESDSGQKSESASGQKSESASDQKSESDSDQKSESDSGQKSESASGQKSESASGQKSESASGQKSESASDQKSESDSDQKSESASEAFMNQTMTKYKTLTQEMSSSWKSQEESMSKFIDTMIGKAVTDYSLKIDNPFSIIGRGKKIKTLKDLYI